MAELLKLISGDCHLVLNQLSGRKNFSNSKGIIYHVDSYFSGHSFRSQISTPKRTIEVYETIPGTKATFMDIFGSLPEDWNKKWLSQSQIIKVCKHFKNWLRTDTYSTFILCNTSDRLLVDEDMPQRSLIIASITLDRDGDVDISKFELDDPVLWDGDFLDRIIVPKCRRLSKKLK